MEDLPSSVAARLRELIYDERAAAYLRIDEALMLTGAGGHLDHYGLAGLRTGEPAVSQVFFLEGLLPLTETPTFFPSVELANGRAADLHLHRDGDAIWAILLDVTDQRDAARRMQQKAYDMTLLQEKEALLNRRLGAAKNMIAFRCQATGNSGGVGFGLGSAGGGCGGRLCCRCSRRCRRRCRQRSACGRWAGRARLAAAGRKQPQYQA